MAARGMGGLQNGEVRSLALRPEAVVINGEQTGANRMQGTIEEVSFLGSVIRIRVRFRENVISLDAFNNPNVSPPERGAQATVSFTPEDVLVLEGAEAT
jgi:putative spermidine/putrescine transport system ATP-binding protein